jgi:hypothetical protein
MEIAEIFSNFVSTYVIFVVVTVIYVAFVYAHPYSKSVKNAIKPFVTGCAVEASVWLALTFVAIGLSTLSAKIAFVFEQVLGTNILSVGLITISLLVVSITFTAHEASNHNHRYDKRTIAIGIFVLIAIALGVFYWLKTSPM